MEVKVGVAVGCNAVDTGASHAHQAKSLSVNVHIVHIDTVVLEVTPVL